MGTIADAFAHFAFFIQGRDFVDAIAYTPELDGVVVQLGEVKRDLLTLGVNTLTDAIARIDRIGAVGAERSVPGFVGGARAFSLAQRVGAARPP